MNIINYKIFKTSEDFVQWQVQDSPKIISVVPMLSGMDGDIKGDGSEGSASWDTSMSVFVTYFED